MKIKSRKLKVQLCKHLDKLFGKENPNMRKINGYVERLVWQAYGLNAIDHEDYNLWVALHHEGEIFGKENQEWYTTFMYEVGAFIELEEEKKELEVK